jgi:hypothetical protein
VIGVKPQCCDAKKAQSNFVYTNLELGDSTCDYHFSRSIVWQEEVNSEDTVLLWMTINYNMSGSSSTNDHPSDPLARPKLHGLKLALWHSVWTILENLISRKVICKVSLCKCSG